eukprot:PhM_4_TR15424/c0_g1_i1/m.29902
MRPMCSRVFASSKWPVSASHRMVSWSASSCCVPTCTSKGRMRNRSPTNHPRFASISIKPTISLLLGRSLLADTTLPCGESAGDVSLDSPAAAFLGGGVTASLFSSTTIVPGGNKGMSSPEAVVSLFSTGDRKDRGPDWVTLLELTFAGRTTLIAATDHDDVGPAHSVTVKTLVSHIAVLQSTVRHKFFRTPSTCLRWTSPEKSTTRPRRVPVRGRTIARSLPPNDRFRCAARRGDRGAIIVSSGTAWYAPCASCSIFSATAEKEVLSPLWATRLAASLNKPPVLSFSAMYAPSPSSRIDTRSPMSNPSTSSTTSQPSLKDMPPIILSETVSIAGKRVATPLLVYSYVLNRSLMATSGGAVRTLTTSSMFEASSKAPGCDSPK